MDNLIYIVTSEGIQVTFIEGIYDNLNDAESCAACVDLDDKDKYHHIDIDGYILNSRVPKDRRRAYHRRYRKGTC